MKIIASDAHNLVESNPDKWTDTIKTLRDAFYQFDKDAIQTRGEPWTKSGKIIIKKDEVDLSCLFIDGSNKSIFVIFSGARGEIYDYYSNPNFPRWTYYKIIDGCFICFDDPMLGKFNNLKLGWFYGDAEKCHAADCYEVVNKICEIKNIARNKKTFFGSSGGGFAAIIAATMEADNLSISLNPQLYIHKWPYANTFSSITGIDLSLPDKFNRNNPYEVLKSSKSRHMLIFNASSARDIRDHLTPLLNEFGRPKVRYGLTQINNILLWIYDAPGIANEEAAHVAFETRYMFCAINYIAQKFRNDAFVADDYQPLALLVNEAWNDHHTLRKRIHQIENRSHNDIAFVDYIKPDAFILERLLENITLEARDVDYNFYTIRNFIPNSLYSIEIQSLISHSSSNITYGIYNFKTQRIVKYFTHFCKNPLFFSFITGTQVNDLGLCIYAGISGHCRLMDLKIPRLYIFRRQLRNLDNE